LFIAIHFLNCKFDKTHVSELIRCSFAVLVMCVPVISGYLALTGEHNELSLPGRCWLPRWNSPGAAVQ